MCFWFHISIYYTLIIHPHYLDGVIVKKFIILYSFLDYKKWFLETYDFSCFSENDIHEFFKETAPEVYPCIPYYGEKDSEYPSSYISIELLDYWGLHIKNHYKTWLIYLFAVSIFNITPILLTAIIDLRLNNQNQYTK